MKILKAINLCNIPCTIAILPAMLDMLKDKGSSTFIFMISGSPDVDKNLSGRILWGGVWLFILTLFASYDGNLVAFLTVSVEKVPFETLEDVLGNTDYSMGVMPASSNEDFFKVNMG